MRRLAGVVASAAAPTSPRRRHLGQRLAHLLGPACARRTAGRRSTASPGNSSRAWPRARGARRHRREQPRALGKAARIARRPRRRDGARARPHAARGGDRSRPRGVLRTCRASQPIWRQDCHALRDGARAVRLRDGIGHPAIEGSGIPGTNSAEAPLKAGEFVLGYLDEIGGLPPMPQPDVLGRNGTYVAFRKLHQRVAAFRRYLTRTRAAVTTRSCSRPR